jgi:Type II secretion system (T2SS), protein M
VTISDRDRKILLVLVPLVILGAYWFLLLSPKREEAATLADQVTQAEADRDAAVAQAEQAEASREGFEADYAAMVRLGKAVPSTVDMPSLLVQLDRAALGTNIRFSSITAGPRASASATTGAAPSTGSTPSGNAAPGGTPASTSAGQAAESAGEAAQTADSANAAAGADQAATPAGPSAAPAALDTVPLTFTFNGSFFSLTDFFHDLKRFVRLSSSSEVEVRGRLLTIDSLTLTPTSFPQMEAQVSATVYLSPKTQGVTAGATPQGPAPSDPGSTPASGDGSAATTPTATAGAR